MILSLTRSAEILCAATVATAVATLPAHAWGREGHRIIAQIAADQLSPNAKAEVSALLGGDAALTMVDAAPWADDIRRSRRDTGPWHYVDIPISASGYDATRDCPRDDCVVAQIERDVGILCDKRLAPPIRAEALKFLIHFVGDVHQPLHSSDNADRGGNEVKIYFGRRKTNLHSLWDTPLVEYLGRDAYTVVASLESSITAAQRFAWAKDGPVAWASETHLVARRVVYSGLSGRGETEMPIILPPDYASQKAPVVRTQLARAGTRLAWILNRAFH